MEVGFEVFQKTKTGPVVLSFCCFSSNVCMLSPKLPDIAIMDQTSQTVNKSQSNAFIYKSSHDSNRTLTKTGNLYKLIPIIHQKTHLISTSKGCIKSINSPIS